MLTPVTIIHVKFSFAFHKVTRRCKPLNKKGNPQQDNYFEQGENIIKNIRQKYCPC